MFLSLLTLLNILFLSSTIQEDKILTCYYSNWAVYRNGNAKYEADDMYPYLCTHIIYAFANINTQTLSLDSSDPWSDFKDGLDNIRKVTSLKNINPNLKVLLSVGGWGRQLQEFNTISGSAKNRELFAKNVKKYLKKYNFDGFDIDWEYPTDKNKYTLLMKALSEEFKRDSSETYLLTVAVSAGASTAAKSYDIKAVSGYLDYINIMTYDFYGQFSPTVGHHTGLYCLDENDQLCTDYAVKYWNSNGAPLSKIIIGLPLYGQGFKTQTRNPQVGDKKIGGTPQGKILPTIGILTYLDYCNAGYTNVWDDTQKSAHGVKDYYWLGYETERSIQEKANYVKDNSLAGMFAWTLGFDDFSGNECNNGKSPMIGAMHRELGIYPGIDWETGSPTNDENSAADDGDLCTSVGYFPIDGCRKFKNCPNAGSKGYVQSCSEGLLFDVKAKACNWDYLVNCDSDSELTSKTPSSFSSRSQMGWWAVILSILSQLVVLLI